MKYIFFILMFITQSLFIFSQNYNKGFKLIYENNLTKAKTIFIKLTENKSNDVVSNYALSIIYSNKNFEEYNLIKAYKYINVAIENQKELDVIQIKNIQNYFSIDSLNKRLNFIDNELKKYIYKNQKDSIFINEFLLLCKNSKHYEDIVKLNYKIEYLKIKDSYSIEHVNSYISKFPNSQYIYEANKLLNELKLWKKIQENINYDDVLKYKNKYPNGKYIHKIDSIKEDMQWLCIKNNSTISLIESYLEEYISGNHVDSAKNLLLKKKNEFIESDIKKYSRNNQILNNFIFDYNGDIHCINNNILFSKCNYRADCWEETYGNISTTAICYSLNNRNLIYRISEEYSIEKSVDGGINWISVNNGLPNNRKIKSIHISPINDDEVYLILQNEGLYKTSDAGFTWKKIINHNVEQFLINSKYPQNLFILIDNKYIVYSNDNGNIWEFAGSLPYDSSTISDEDNRILFFLTYVDNDQIKIIAFTKEDVFISVGPKFLSWEKCSNGLTKGNQNVTAYVNDNEIILSTGINNIPYLFYTKKDTIKWEMLACFGNYGWITGITKMAGYNGYLVISNSKLAYLDTNINLIPLNYALLSHSEIEGFEINDKGKEPIYYVILNDMNSFDCYKMSVWQLDINNNKEWIKIYHNANDIYIYDDRYKKQNIFISPHNTNELWLIYADYYTRYSLNNGSYWQNLDYVCDGCLIEPKSNLIFDPFDQNTIYYMKNSNLIRFDRTTKNETALRQTNSFVISCTDNKRIININDGLIEKSVDGGWTFTQIQNDFKDKLLDLYDAEISIMPYFYKGDTIIFSVSGDAITYLLISYNDFKDWKILKKTKNSEIAFVTINPNDVNNILLGLIDCSFRGHGYDNNRTGYSIYYTLDKENWGKIYEFKMPEGEYFENYNGYIKGGLIKKIDGIKCIYLYGKNGIFCSNNDGESWIKLGGIIRGIINR